MSPRSDFEEFFASLNAEQVRYLVVGAYAVAFHAHPRFTKDLDVLIEPTRENSGAMINALRAFGFGELELAVDDFCQPDRVVQIGFPPNRIDLMTTIEGVSFETSWPRRVQAPFGQVPVSYLSLDDLILNKRAVDRPKDREDLRLLQQAREREKGSGVP